MLPCASSQPMTCVVSRGPCYHCDLPVFSNQARFCPDNASNGKYIHVQCEMEARAKLSALLKDDTPLEHREQEPEREIVIAKLKGVVLPLNTRFCMKFPGRGLELGSVHAYTSDEEHIKVVMDFSKDEKLVLSVNDITLVEGEEYVVEKIMQERFINSEREFMVKWKGYPMSENTWEAAESFISEDGTVNEMYTIWLNTHPNIIVQDSRSEASPGCGSVTDILSESHLEEPLNWDEASKIKLDIFKRDRREEKQRKRTRENRAVNRYNKRVRLENEQKERVEAAVAATKGVIKQKIANIVENSVASLGIDELKNCVHESAVGIAIVSNLHKAIYDVVAFVK